ncbi:MAG: hypothetical protein KDE31_31180, partial [Caldilineaceae bacterium]|nr:hypothetical protein [Caldilineaceae bacterium]
MILSTDGTYPALAIVASRPKYTAAPPIEPIGVLIVKQTLQPGGHLGGEAQLLLEDVLYESPPCKPGDLEIHLESDLAPYKPMLDLVVVRDSCKRGGFGHVRIAHPGTTPSKWMKLDYGWRSRVRDPRQKAAGDANGFRPPAVTDGEMLPLTELLKLPKNYQSSYNNGGRIPDLPLLGPGDQVWF